MHDTYADVHKSSEGDPNDMTLLTLPDGIPPENDAAIYHTLDLPEELIVRPVEEVLPPPVVSGQKGKYYSPRVPS